MDVTNWQEWAVALILTACIAFVLYKAYQMARCLKRKDNPCNHCTNICMLKNRKKLQR